MNIKELLLNVGLIISLGFGIFHFFIPDVFKWFSYIPDAPRNLVVSIKWTNYFFSLLLSGLSLLLLLFQRRVLEKDVMAIVFYIFMVIVWLSRVIITILLPFNGTYDLTFLIQVLIFLAVFIILLIPIVLILYE
jgi:hypothetical protein